MASPNAGLVRQPCRVLTQTDQSNPMTTQTATESNSKNKLLWIIIALLVLILAVAGAGGAWYFMSGDAPAADEEQVTESTPPPPPVFVELKPFTVNLNEISDRILYIGITLKVEGEEAAAQLQDHMPEVRNRILMVLTGQQGDELTTPAGKRALSESLVAAFEEPLESESEGVNVSDALFTDFIVQ